MANLPFELLIVASNTARENKQDFISINPPKINIKIISESSHTPVML